MLLIFIGLTTLFGPVGFAIAVVIWIFRSSSDARNFIGDLWDEIITPSHHQQEALLTDTTPTIADMYPIIEIFHFFGLRYENKWSHEKIETITNAFPNIDDRNKTLLHQKLKNSDIIKIEDSINKFNQLSVDDEDKQITLSVILDLMLLSGAEYTQIEKDSLLLSKKINYDLSKCRRILDEFKKHHGINIKTEDELAEYAKILGVSTNASLDEIKIAWRKKMKAFHPDSNVNVSPEVMAMLEAESKKLNLAYEYLKKSV